VSLAAEKLSINQVTTRDRWTLAQAIEGYARHGVQGITVWYDKLREIGADAAARRIRDSGLAVSGYCVGGILASADVAEGRTRLDENRRMIDEAAAIGSPCVVIIGGGLDQGDRDLPGARVRALERIAELVPHARGAGVVLALEPLHPMVCATRSVLTTLRQANDWCEALAADDAVGIAVDTYNVWWDPEVDAQIERAAGRIAAFHVADWLVDTRDLRFDRGMPGDGVIDIPRLRSQVEAAGYQGQAEVEILSTSWWQRDPDEVVRLVVERSRTSI
jgi:sugar phosphate isomerase/epimerase